MAAPYTAASPAWQSEMRSVTPATNNINRRYPSAPRMGEAPSTAVPGSGDRDNYRSMTPNRYYNRQDDTEEPSDARTPSSTGLIRLSLKKPMGIVFEPMYDPNQATVQRGVRICDLPRTGAAALSRKLQVGDELLQINDTTVSRMTFDEIMDFIIEADPDAVNLLFRRPRKETLQARQGVQQKLNAAQNKDNPSTVKWVDEERGGSSSKKPPKDRSASKKKDSKKSSKRIKKETPIDDEDTLQSSTVGEESSKGNRSRKKSKSRKDPYESESFLDVLIDTICSNSNSVCRDTFRPSRDEEYFSDEEESFASQEDEDEDTYATYEESLEPRKPVRKPVVEEPSQDDEIEAEIKEKEKRRKNARKEAEEKEKAEKKKYMDDGTLETMDSVDREKPEILPVRKHQPPLGLAPVPQPMPVPEPVRAAPARLVEEPHEDTDVNPTAPVQELEYDFDAGADVSVMESLGGPSLLIEKARAAQNAATQAVKQSVPAEVMEKFGLDYPANFGFTRKQTIEGDPLRYYTFVVKELLEEHEPEKVRLLDKLLAKYQGREDHLVQKLSVRYNRLEEGTPSIPEEDDEVAFTDAVKKSKASLTTEAAVNTARERMQAVPEDENQANEWAEKEHKEPDHGDLDDEESVSGSEYSRDSVDGTSPAVIAQVSELLNYVYGKTSVPGQIDRVSTIMRAYEGREAVLLELLETKALIKANKEKENADNLPSFLRNSQAAQKNIEASDLPPVTPMATQPPGAINDDISSMSGVSSPAGDRTLTNNESEDVEVKRGSPKKLDPTPMSEAPKSNGSGRVSSKPPATPDKNQKKKKGLFGGLFGKKKSKDAGGSTTPARPGARHRG
jgi:hypothetical protein